MALHAGSHEQFDGTLGAAIERALAGELQGVKQKALPDMGKNDRRMLFNAIAQGVVDYLREHESDFTIVLTNKPPNAPLLAATLQIQSPSFAASVVTTTGGKRVNYTGQRWPSGSVGLVWEDTGQSAGSTSPSGGTISGQITPPAGMSGKQRLGARNNAGDAVVVEVSL
jgi:hypothetical protein